MRILLGTAKGKYFVMIKYNQMFNLFMVVYTAVLFYVLTPGILLTLPSRSSKMLVAATHALLFALIYKFTHKAAWRLSLRLEGFQDKAPAKPTPMPKPAGNGIPPSMMPKGMGSGLPPMLIPKKK
jgi:hypothetical protein